MPLAAGTKLDSYEVLGLLGTGGMGEVYRARDSVLRREVAIKVLPSFVSRDSDRQRRFEQEAHAVSALNHPNILAVHQFGFFAGAPYLVSELLEGSTLRQLIHRGPISIHKAIDYGVQIAHGLAAAHQKGIVHRDLKPESLFVTNEGRIKILDFSLAKMMSPQTQADSAASTTTHRTHAATVMGTTEYMSPEQVRGKTIDHRTDIFAFGAILYEMLTGKRAFQRSTSAETITAILSDDPPSISKMVQTTSPGLQRIAHRCLEKDPEQRYQSAQDLAFALEALSDSGSGQVERVAQSTRSRWLWVAAGVVVALGAVLFASWRIPPAVPVVDSVTQLTDDGQSKGWMVSDGSRIYFNENLAGKWKVAQVSVTGGATALVKTPFETVIAGMRSDGSELLAYIPDSLPGEGSLLLIPLPTGEARRLGFVDPQSANLLPDGRMVFAQLTHGKDANGSDSRTDWLIAEKDGSNQRKVVSLPGYAGDIKVAPDGLRILLVENYDGARSLLEIATDGTGLHEIRRFNPDECCFNWTPDQKYLAYQSGNAIQSDIWLLPRQTGFFHRQGKPIRLTNGPLPYTFPLPSRDGKRIFVLGTKQRAELVRYDLKSHQFLPFLSGISATDPTFSRDGKWVAYSSYPDHTLWRSRGDGSERMQLTYPPLDVQYPSISPDGTKVSFHTNKEGVFVIGMEGGTQQKISDNAVFADWSPDGSYLSYHSQNMETLFIADLRTGEKSALPSSEGIVGFWVDQDTLAGVNTKWTSFITFNLKTRKWIDLGPKGLGHIQNLMLSPEGKYLYFATGDAEPKVERIRLADQRVETITSLRDFRRVLNGGDTQINVAPDGSPVFTRDTGDQEIYALNIRWP